MSNVKELSESDLILIGQAEGQINGLINKHKSSWRDHILMSALDKIVRRYKDEQTGDFSKDEFDVLLRSSEEILAHLSSVVLTPGEARQCLRMMMHNNYNIHSVPLLTLMLQMAQFQRRGLLPNENNFIEEKRRKERITANRSQNKS
ncbi:MAG: hypothetical protein WCJ59_00220 [bacterium]